MIRCSCETSSRNLATYNMNKVNSSIQRCNLTNPPLTNDKFTWSNLTRKRLVTFLDFIVFFILHNEGLDSLIIPSDFSQESHLITSLLYLRSLQISSGDLPLFISTTILSTWQTFQDNILNWWIELQQEGHPGYSFMHKLKQMA